MLTQKRIRSGARPARSATMIILGSLILYSLCPVAAAQLHKAGPSGGPGGEPFEINPQGTVAQIWLGTGAWLDHITVNFRRSNGTYRSSPKAGGEGGADQIFDLLEGEYLTAISGTYDQYVNQIRFHTNTGRSSVLYGTREGGIRFDYESPRGCRIIGFHGNAGRFVNSIGVYFACP